MFSVCSSSAFYFLYIFIGFSWSFFTIWFLHIFGLLCLPSCLFWYLLSGLHYCRLSSPKANVNFPQIENDCLCPHRASQFLTVSVSYLSTEYKPTEPGAIKRQLKLQKVIMKIALHLIKRSAYNYCFPCRRFCRHRLHRAMSVCVERAFSCQKRPRLQDAVVPSVAVGWFSSVHKQLANKYTYSFYCPNGAAAGPGGDHSVSVTIAEVIRTYVHLYNWGWLTRLEVRFHQTVLFAHFY